VSTESAWLLSWTANLVLPLGLTALGAALAQSARVQEQLAAYHARLACDLRYLHLHVLPRQLMLAQLGVASCALVLAAALHTPWPLQLLLPSLLGPGLWLRRRREARSSRIEQQLDGWLLALSNALKANPSLGDSIAASARLIDAPLAQELSLLLKETRLGMPLDRALRQLAERVRSPIVSAAFATLLVARNTGGNLSDTLAASAASLREMARLQGVVRAKTAEGRAQAYLIGVLPGPLVLLLHCLDPKLLEPLWLTDRGHLVLAGAGVLWLSALLWARRIVAVDI
jgi:tight adherence protein B